MSDVQPGRLEEPGRDDDRRSSTSARWSASRRWLCLCRWSSPASSSEPGRESSQTAQHNRLTDSRHIVVRDRGHGAGLGSAAAALDTFLRDASLENSKNPCEDREIRFETGR